MRCRATALAIAAHAESGIESRSTGDMARPVPLPEVDAIAVPVNVEDGVAADEVALLEVARGEVVSDSEESG